MTEPFILPHTFEANQPASAQEVNENFTACYTKIKESFEEVDTLREAMRTSGNDLTEVLADITNLETNKVDKITGMGLSTNDFTTAEKTKLSGIATGAEVNVQPNWTQTDNNQDDFIKNKPSTFTPSSHTQDISTINGLQNALDSKLSTTHNHSGVYEPANANIQTHISSTSNPHSVTKAQVGLGNVSNTDTTTTTNITDSTNKRFITDAQKTVLQNTSGTNSGDETSSSITTKLGYTPANDVSAVHLAGTETITGAKTFSANMTLCSNEYLDNTTYANQKGIIYKGSGRFIHNFNYGNNGTVTTVGGNVFIAGGNVTMGATATSNEDSSYNTAVGYASFNNNTTGARSSAFGYGSLMVNTTGTKNSAFGFGSLSTNSTGSFNTAFGYQTLSNNTEGGTNLALGASALQSNTTGSGNIGIGYGAGRYIADSVTGNLTSTSSIYIGGDTKSLANGDSNEIVIGNGTTGSGSNTITFGNTSVTKTILRGVVVQGTYSTTPTSTEGGIYYNSTDKHFYGYNGTTWKQLDN